MREIRAAQREHYACGGVKGLLTFAGRPELRVRQVRVQRQAFCAEERELTRGEHTRLCRAAAHGGRERLCLLLQTICGTGIRVSELRYITVESVRRGETAVNCKAKTRTVFIVKALRRKLLRYAAEQGIKSGMIFVTRTGKPLGRTNIWREMKSLCREAGVNAQKVFPHNLRHLFATAFYHAYKDIVKLSDVLGHSSIETTRIYLATSAAEHQRQLEQLRLVL